MEKLTSPKVDKDMHVHPFSIIIPVYNTEKYLAKCLDSVINQSFSDIEIIIVNDDTPDNCEDIIRSYQAKDSRIKYIKHEQNKGLYHARETGVLNASGKYILHVDSDDTLDVRLCEELYPATSPSPDCITYNVLYDFGKENLASAKKNSQEINQNFRDFFEEKEFFYEMCSIKIHGGALVQKITRRDLALQVYQEIDLQERCTMAEDYLYNVWYAYYCTTVKHIQFDGYIYNCTNISSAIRGTYTLERCSYHLNQLSIVIGKMHELCHKKDLPISTIESLEKKLLRDYWHLSSSIVHQDVLVPKITAIFDNHIIIDTLLGYQKNLLTQQITQQSKLKKYRRRTTKLMIALACCIVAFTAYVLMT